MCDYANANCYGYALGINFNATPGDAVSVKTPVEWDATGTEITEAFVTQLMDACVHDGLGRERVVGQREIAVFINVYAQGLDYHFYRNDGGTWSHKLGNTGSVVAGLASPEVANAALVGHADSNGQTIIAQQFCGYLYFLNRPTIDMFEED